MFSGLVEASVQVRSFRRRGPGARLELEAPRLPRGRATWKPVLGESIAVSGCCLSVCAIGPGGRTSYDLSAETLERTWLGALRAGRAVNVERSVRLADRLGGHLVSGHVEAVGKVAAIDDPGDGGRVFTFEVPRGFERWLLEKGSVCVDGISLTIVRPRARRFRVAVIPETLRVTTLGAAEVGDPVHLEADQIARWVERLVAPVKRR